MTLGRAGSPTEGHLELLLVRNQLLLLTEGALYSDGKRYLPAVTLAKHLGGSLRDVKSVLVLGAGVGSIVRVLRERGCHPSYTLVEKNPTVLRWAMETLAAERQPRADQLEAICQDAEAFVAENQRRYDLVFIDLFQGRKVPAFVTTAPFLRRCRDSLAPGGRVVLNYLVDDEQQWQELRTLLLQIFPGAYVASIHDNRILFSEPCIEPCPASGGSAAHGT